MQGNKITVVDGVSVLTIQLFPYRGRWDNQIYGNNTRVLDRRCQSLSR